ncbi:PaaI family thioesterase [Gordonia sp. CPCC 206044]|uniref:PaaI family thioesterase n=1 Tax=Gordonia sp. CPCC 206044 TaxID=3140793 RepID=UPI003AF3B5B6
MDSAAPRQGPFWDGMLGRTSQPPAAQTLGLRFVDADSDSGTIDLAFTARAEWTNPFGNVLGAFVAAMLYDTVGPTLLATLDPEKFQSTEEFSVRFLRPLRPGPVTAHGRVVDRSGATAELAATLYDADGPAATATATARVIDVADAPDAV